MIWTCILEDIQDRQLDQHRADRFLVNMAQDWLHLIQVSACHLHDDVFGKYQGSDIQADMAVACEHQVLLLV
jgi:hypothetical protein